MAPLTPAFESLSRFSPLRRPMQVWMDNSRTGKTAGKRSRTTLMYGGTSARSRSHAVDQSNRPTTGACGSPCTPTSQGASTMRSVHHRWNCIRWRTLSLYVAKVGSINSKQRTWSWTMRIRGRNWRPLRILFRCASLWRRFARTNCLCSRCNISSILHSSSKELDKS